MKWTIAILLIFTLPTLSFSQEIKIGIVNVDSMVNSILVESKFDSIYGINKESYLKLGKVWVKKFNDNVDKISKTVECGPPERIEKVQRKLEQLQSDIAQFEKFFIDTLPIYRNDFIQEIDSMVVLEYQKIGREVKGEIISQRKIEALVRKYQILFLRRYNEYILKIKNDYH